MFRISAGRILRLILVVVLVYMVGSLLSRHVFRSTDLVTPQRAVTRPPGQHTLVNRAYPAVYKGQSPDKTLSVEDTQDLVNYMGQNLGVRYKVTNNLISTYQYIGRITLSNRGNKPIQAGPWKIYFYHPVDIEDVRHSEMGAEVANRMMYISHVNGGLFSLQPTALFAAIAPGQSLKIPFSGGRWMCSKTDVYPNWYVTATGIKPATIESTAGESLSFVEDFNSEPLWKRAIEDKHNPFTPKQRFLSNEIEDMGKPGGYVIPTPLQVNAPYKDGRISGIKDWVIMGSTLMQNEVSYLAEKTGMKEVRFKPKTKYIGLVEGNIELPGADVIMQEAYSLNVDPDTESVTIMSPTPNGAFNGIQTLLSLLSPNSTLPVVKIVDAPRFAYRGFMLDVGRNFRPKEEVMELIDVMSMYKLNKFHFHLTEDEGWRLEIPSLPELTLVGSKRCHDLNEAECLLPFNGAGLKGKNDGFYSVADYREILKYAQRRHVEVLPEIDVPGHCHAAIKAMELRYRNLKHRGRMTQAEEFLLSDPNDQSEYHSIQQFNDNVLNVCMDSTYKFVEQIIIALIEMHKDIQPLKTLHIGGDEVPHEALLGSPRCKKFMKEKSLMSQDNLTVYFTERVFKIAEKYGLKIQGWEDVFYKRHVIQKFKGAGDTTINVWNNIWRKGMNVHRAHDLANNDYKVVMGPATHLYLDHPHEPDPEERGLFWATRYVNTYTVFGFMPENYYDNMEINSFGSPARKSDICVEPSDCPKLLKPKNIAGMEAHLWSETVRMKEHLHTMVFPRLLAMAERAWHRANWELEPDQNIRQRKKNADWNRFGNTLGYHELPRLEKLGIMYHIPLPGALIYDGKLKMNTAFPGLPFVASSDGGVTWKKLVTDNRVSGQTLLATGSIDGTRRSRSIQITIN